MSHFLVISRIYRFILMLFIFAIGTSWSEADVIDLSPSQDTYVDSKRKNNSYGSNSYIRLRETNQYRRNHKTHSSDCRNIASYGRKANMDKLLVDL